MKTNIRKIRLRYQLKIFMRFNKLGQISRIIQRLLHVPFNALVSLAHPIKPELQNINMPSALHRFIAQIVAGIVRDLILHEQIARVQPERLLQEPLVLRQNAGTLLHD
jgi:hypothetical protein